MIFIQSSLRSSPGSLAPGQAGTLRIGLLTDESPAETAQIQYEIISPAGVVFTSTNSTVIVDSVQVFSTGTTASTAYALRGPAGLINIRASVTPSMLPATSATAVALTSASFGIGAATRGRPRSSQPAPAPARKKAARKKAAPKATRRKVAAGKKTTNTTTVRRKAAVKKASAGKRTAPKRPSARRKTASKRKVAKGK